MLDLDAIEARAKDAAYKGAKAFAWMARDDVLALIAALRAVLDTTPEELAEAMIAGDANITAAFSYQRAASAALAYLERKAGVTP